MKSKYFAPIEARHAFWFLTAFIVLICLTGGSARDDVMSLAILRPAAVLFLGFALWSLRLEQVRRFRFLFGAALAALLIALIHLAPLPPGWWTALPGRELAVKAERIGGIESAWRPLSLVPYRTWNTFFSLLVPFAVLALLARMTREQHQALLPLLIGFGLLSGILGLLQTIGPADSFLYFYRVTNEGLGVGLFANRNHQAILLACMLPMLAVYASGGFASIEQARFRAWMAIGIGAVLVPLILVTGSRLGLILGLGGLASIPFLYRKPVISTPAKRTVRRLDPRHVLIAVGVASLALTTVLLSRGRAFERLTSAEASGELRLTSFGTIWSLIERYFPAGSGLGTFVEVYQADEPDALLSASYLNHAHNDWLELALTAGIPGLIGLLIVVGAWGLRSWSIVRASRETASLEHLFHRLGAILTLFVAVASFVDYPLRVPSLAVLFVIAAVWMCDATPPRNRRGSATAELGQQAAAVASNDRG